MGLEGLVSGATYYIVALIIYLIFCWDLTRINPFLFWVGIVILFLVGLIMILGSELALRGAKTRG